MNKVNLLVLFRRRQVLEKELLSERIWPGKQGGDAAMKKKNTNCKMILYFLNNLTFASSILICASWFGFTVLCIHF